jgi:hypothetical protein
VIRTGHEVAEGKGAQASSPKMSADGVLPPPRPVTPASPSTDKADNVLPPPGSGPSVVPLEWLPHKPGILVESDCFVNAEAVLVFPHLSGRLTAPVQFGEGGPSRLVSLHSTGLNATVSPLIQVGAFRFGPGYGELAVSYRLLATEGNDFSLSGSDAGGLHVRSRLNFQSFSLDYIRNDCPLRDDLLLTWDVGVRLQVVFFDTQEQRASSSQQASSYFFGAGPRAGLCLTQTVAPDVGAYGRFDTALIAGYNTAQNFVLAITDPVLGALSGSARQQETQLSPSFAVQLGLAWSPSCLPGSSLRTGYLFEQWYGLGRVESSRGDLTAHGLFLRLEASF